MTEAEAATLLGISQPKLSKVLRGQFRRLPLCKLMKCVTQLGQDVQLIVRQRRD